MSRVPARSVHPAAFLWWRRRAQSRMHPFSGWPRRALSNPTADWLAQQIVEAFPWGTAPTYLVRDNDGAYGRAFTNRVWTMGIRDRPISPRSPWQNPCAERLIGTLRRECLDHVLIFGEQHLRRILALYSSYYNDESYCLSFYVIDSKRLGCRYFSPVGCDRRLRTRSTRQLVSSRSRI